MMRDQFSKLVIKCTKQLMKQLSTEDSTAKTEKQTREGEDPEDKSPQNSQRNRKQPKK